MMVGDDDDDDGDNDHDDDDDAGSNSCNTSCGDVDASSRAKWNACLKYCFQLFVF